MTAVLQVATPQGDSGKILTSGGDYLFRYHEEAKAQAATSLLMPEVLVPERQGSAPQRFPSKTSDLIIKSGPDETSGLADWPNTYRFYVATQTSKLSLRFYTVWAGFCRSQRAETKPMQPLRMSKNTPI
jgi:hypothetical protein